MKTWADEAGIIPPSRSIDRDAGEGPPRCCVRRLVAADALVCYDELALERLAELAKRFPHLAEITPLYLCDGCADTLIREEIITREDRAIDFGLPQEIVDKAREQDLKAR
jgi:hypothetical protein